MLVGSAIIRPAKSVSKYQVGKYIITHTVMNYGNEEMEMYDLSKPNSDKYIMRAFVSDGEVTATSWRYSGYYYDFISDKWYKE